MSTALHHYNIPIVQQSYGNNIITIELTSLLMEDAHAYLTKRIETILRREVACLQIELHRRLGEVGRARLDPRLVDDFLETHIATPKPKIVPLQRDGLTFYTLSRTPQDDSQRVIEEKLALYKRAIRLKDSPPNVECVRRMFLAAARRASRQRPDARLRLYLPAAPAQSAYAFRGVCSEDRIAFMVFVSNDLGWIYPHNPAIWVPLSYCSTDEVAVPVIIGRIFHPSCFSLFKTLGILGHQTYKVYFSPKVWPDFDRVGTVLGFTTASTASPKDRHTSFFAHTLPNHIPAAFTNFNQLSAIISQFAIEEALADANLEPNLRLERFLSFLSRLPPTKRVKRLRDDVTGGWKSL